MNSECIRIYELQRSIHTPEECEVDDELEIENHVLRQFFHIGLADTYTEEAIDGFFQVLNNPETDILDCDDELRSLLSPMDHGDTRFIIKVYTSASHAFDYGYKLKDEYDVDWLINP